MLKKYRRFTGLFLIVLAAILLFAWETRGRELILMQDVCVTKAEIEAGEELNASMLKSVSVPRNAIVTGAILPSEADSINGKVSAGYIPPGAQMSASLALTKEETRIKSTSYFVINKDWIYMRSGSLRAGDTVEIRSSDGMTNFGSFTAAFIKDAEENEIENIQDSGISFSEKDKDDRSGSSAAVDHIEIETELSTYLAIKAYAESAGEPSLLIIRRDI
ncbi:MAG: SAF domain-containing protein [Clostridiales Family XIII bacterium]|jgi:hypothetical protein|nr:SAF domain-containing protein [Clostridiales Family XIII bacterium]